MFIMLIMNNWIPLCSSPLIKPLNTHVSKSYLSKLIRTGKIIAERQPNGEFRTDPSELDRIPQSVRKDALKTYLITG